MNEHAAGRDGREPWRVLIVEDDPAVTLVHRELVARVGGFVVVGAVADGGSVPELIVTRRPDLVLLDLELRGISGITVLRRLRAAGSRIEVIAVTAARDAATVRSLVHLGVVDYLIKPFAPERLFDALRQFEQRAQSIRGRDLIQSQIDEVAHRGSRRPRWLPKGLSPTALAAVRATLETSRAAMSASEVAESTGLARVTARRYLEYLVATRQASECVSVGRPGRPRKLYLLES